MRHIRRIIVSCLLAAVALAAATALARPVLAPRARDVQPTRTLSERNWHAVPAPKHRSTRRRKTHRPGSKIASNRGDPVLLGDQSIESSVGSTPARSPEAFSFVDQLSGTATSISVYIDSHNHATTLIAGLYLDTAGHPGSLAGTGYVTSPKSGAWNTVALGRTPTVSAGTTYWVALLGKKGTLAFRDANGAACKSETSSQTNLNSLQSRWRRGPQGGNCPISAYVSGTTSGPTVPPPSITVAPIISGNPTQGDTLTTDNGSWSNNPTGYRYAWQDCDPSGIICTNISGANSSSYTLVANDVGHTVISVVTAMNAGGSTSASSNPTAIVAAPTPPPPPPRPRTRCHRQTRPSQRSPERPDPAAR